MLASALLHLTIQAVTNVHIGNCLMSLKHLPQMDSEDVIWDQRVSSTLRAPHPDDKNRLAQTGNALRHPWGPPPRPARRCWTFGGKVGDDACRACLQRETESRGCSSCVDSSSHSLGEWHRRAARICSEFQGWFPSKAMIGSCLADFLRKDLTELWQVEADESPPAMIMVCMVQNGKHVDRSDPIRSPRSSPPELGGKLVCPLRTSKAHSRESMTSCCMRGRKRRATNNCSQDSRRRPAGMREWAC